MRSSNFTPLGTVLVIVLLGGCSVHESESGTSQVVLVDFSKSFAPLTTDDSRALREVADVTAELARNEWKSPVSILWWRIQSASLVSTTLCSPPEFQPMLIKGPTGGSKNGLDDADEFKNTLQRCAASTVEQSSAPSDQAPYTDISGALALAAEQGKTVSGARYIILLSDFVEDIPPGKNPVNFHLNGERVLLLHRPGLQHPPNGLSDHMKAVEAWRRKLLQGGASAVATLPIGSATHERITRALTVESKTETTNKTYFDFPRRGTDVVVLQNLPDTIPPSMLRNIPEALKVAASDWTSPLTITWAEIPAQSDAFWRGMPPLEFVPRLIKESDAVQAKNFKDGKVSTQEDFVSLLTEYAKGMEHLPSRSTKVDTGLAIRFYESAGALDSAHLFIILSDFANTPESGEVAPNLHGTKLVMLAGPDRADVADEGIDYERRVAVWEKWFRDHDARVCRLPLVSLTGAALSRVLMEPKAGCWNER